MLKTFSDDFQIMFKFFLLNNEITIYVDKKMRIENFPKPKQSDPNPKPDEFIDVSLDPSYFSLDSPFKHGNIKECWQVVLPEIYFTLLYFTYSLFYVHK